MCSTPDIRTNLDREDMQQAREQDRMEKARQEMHEDNKEGDTIVQERKTTKANPP